jgi:hypothetical protein
MKEKRIYFVLLALAAVFAILAACGSGDVVDIASPEYSEVVAKARDDYSMEDLIKGCKDGKYAGDESCPNLDEPLPPEPEPSSSSYEPFPNISSSSNSATEASSSSQQQQPQESSSSQQQQQSSSSLQQSSSSLQQSSSSQQQSSSSQQQSSSSSSNPPPPPPSSSVDICASWVTIEAGTYTANIASSCSGAQLTCIGNSTDEKTVTYDDDPKSGGALNQTNNEGWRVNWTKKSSATLTVSAGSIKCKTDW